MQSMKFALILEGRFSFPYSFAFSIGKINNLAISLKAYDDLVI